MDMQGRRTQTEPEVKVEPVPTAGVHSVVNKVLAYTLSTVVVMYHLNPMAHSTLLYHSLDRNSGVWKAEGFAPGW